VRLVLPLQLSAAAFPVSPDLLLDLDVLLREEIVRSVLLILLFIVFVVFFLLVVVLILEIFSILTFLGLYSGAGTAGYRLISLIKKIHLS